jgi:hypothetical protein
VYVLPHEMTAGRAVHDAERATKPRATPQRHRSREDHVMFTLDEAAHRKDGSERDRLIAAVIETTLDEGTRETGEQYQVFLLSGLQDPDTISLAQPVTNDTLSASGKPWPGPSDSATAASPASPAPESR